MRTQKILAALVIPVLFGGCSTLTTQAEREECIFGTALAGAAGGSIASPLGGGAGMIGGGLLGLLLCGDAQPAPEPAPEPEITGNFIVPDDDNDGVPNHSDKCPFTAPGVKVDANGCAEDSDGDGVPDYLDKCPETPLGTPVDANGCSAILATLEGVHFNFDSATLTSEAKSILNSVASTISTHPSQNIVIEGHTDSTGSDSYNLDLSQRRAESVMNYLTSKGVSSSRLRAVGRGESDPVASNSDAAGRKMNRRVEILAR